MVFVYEKISSYSNKVENDEIDFIFCLSYTVQAPSFQTRGCCLRFGAYP